MRRGVTRESAFLTRSGRCSTNDVGSPQGAGASLSIEPRLRHHDGRERIGDESRRELDSVGDDQFRAIRELRRTRAHVKLIVLASDPTSETVLEALRSHAFSYFHDMSNPTALGDMLRHALEEPAWDDGIEVISARPEWISLRIRCKMLTVERLLQFMRELRTDLPEPERESLGTACREMLLNAVEHGGGFDADQAVEVHRVKTARFVLYAIRDPGEGFSFDALPQAAVSNPDDPPLQHAEYRERHGLRPGGLGLLVSRGLVDELIHSAATKCC